LAQKEMTTPPVWRRRNDHPTRFGAELAQNDFFGIVPPFGAERNDHLKTKFGWNFVIELIVGSLFVC
jgi:hypothetical protein